MKTLKKGNRGDDVRALQDALVEAGHVQAGAPAVFDGDTEAAVRAFQAANGLEQDGMAGCRTLVVLGLDPASLAPLLDPKLALVAAAPFAGLFPVPMERVALREAVLREALRSPVRCVDWARRGRAPIGYVKGMACAYARVYDKLRKADPAAVEMARAASADAARDALRRLSSGLAAAGLAADADGADTLRASFVVLFGLGMLESAGRYCEGRDVAADNTAAETAEAGLFQTSWSIVGDDALMGSLFDAYSGGTDLVDVFREGVTCSPSDLTNHGSPGRGLDHQALTKACPAYAVELAALGLRRRCRHWGPIQRRSVELRLECDALFRAVQDLVDRAGAPTL